MKKYRIFAKLLISSLLFFCANPVFAQLSVQSQQILMPKKVYIGDTAELRCTFNSDLDLFKQLSKNESKELSVTSFTNLLNQKEYDIKKIVFSNTGVNLYSLSITFVPWKTGIIIFPAYDVVEGFCNAISAENNNGSSLIISFEGINIVSITEQENITSPRGFISPLLIPGTTYKVYIAIIFIIILIFGILEAIVKHKKISTFIKNQKLLRKYKKNKILTEKKLTKLLECEESDKEIAALMQQIMRNYLSVRFEFNFANSGASEIMNAFYKATNNLASEEKTEAVEQISAMFIRTDFIRYSNNSYGKTKSKFNKDEKSNLIENLIADIEKIEIPEKPKSEESEVSEDLLNSLEISDSKIPEEKSEKTEKNKKNNQEAENV